jgi:phospholipid/cholesterol/gamma-HCH transport system substrate-binding protein
MKFKIRFADKIVGLLFVLALVSLIFVIFMLGSKQRWFARDYQFKTYFESAAGLSNNMAILYKGFTIGNVRSFDLTRDNRVEVLFFIYDTYIDRVTGGSLVELSVSPIGLGSQFLFYPGLGREQLEEGALIPAAASGEGRALIREGLALVPNYDDSITQLISRADTLLQDIDGAAVLVRDALAGSGDSSIGRTMGDIEETARGLTTVPGAFNGNLDTLTAELESLLSSVQPVISNVETLTGELIEPGGLLFTALDTDGPVYTGLVESLSALSGTLRNLERVIAFVPSQLPQIAGILGELRTALGTAEDVLIALTNNPLLKKGIPEGAETQSNGTNPRDIAF